jgi:ubiquinone/menaquinone biosynthesis C-methylase UbiE
MPTILWTGKLSLPMTVLINTNNALAWLTGNARDTLSMKKRVSQGYEGAFSDHVTMYDDLGLGMQTRAATAQLEGLDLHGMQVLDVGCGTGAISFVALQQGADKVTGGDISNYMLGIARAKADKLGYGADRIDFRWLDAESLPFEDARFDFVVTGMTLGLIPDQKKAVQEMVRVLRPGCLLAVGAHGPEHYWEACDAAFRIISKRYVIGYRLEFWPRSEKEVRRLLDEAGLVDIHTKRLTWRNTFKTGEEGYDFFSAITSNFWYANVPAGHRDEENKRARAYFGRKGVVVITDDVILAYGRKP